ncbi:hypothetical protein [Luteipulveratus halotolerans]|uniref:Uncharacterized protein n=1 Tax=Luteipulveratus halotolerans TaxID=1631356 RepID=A0A0L6CJ64_9MICO|nr:hypothetical protein [Luteipulveratus halotolerans]KNX37774.1 hypothetical protein VV01_12435 [Luteipulveratus halotolerans]
MIRPVLVAVCAALAAVGTAAPSWSQGADTTMTSHPGPAQPSAAPAEVGGVTLPQLPAGLGEHSAFGSEDDGVQITTGVWESTNAEGAVVDLSVTVVRSDRFSSPAAFHDWVVPWQERPSEEAAYTPTKVHGTDAWLAGDQILWLLRPGVGVSVTLDKSRFDAAALPSIAAAAHETASEGTPAPK